MKKINKNKFITFFIAILLVITLTSCDYRSVTSQIDIRGGVAINYAPKDLDRVPTEEELAAVRAILETRLDYNNILDCEIIIDDKMGEVIVHIPWKEDETDFDAKQIAEELGETAQLTFRDIEGNLLLDGKHITKSDVVVDQETNQPIITLEFDDEGSRLFADATAANIGKQIAIFMDETFISAPSVQETITGGQAIISGLESLEEAQTLSNKINAGALPFAIEVKSFNVISPARATN